MANWIRPLQGMRELLCEKAGKERTQRDRIPGSGLQANHSQAILELPVLHKTED